MTPNKISRRGFHLAAASTLASLGLGQRATAGVTRQEEVNPLDAVASAVAHPARISSDLARDGSRQPQRILDFFDIKPGQLVADIQAGNGYYTELLSRTVGDSGHVFCVNDQVTQRLYGQQLTQRLERSDFDESNVTRIDAALTEMNLPDYLDRVLLIRFYHDFAWMEVDRAAFNATIFASLKPGGVFGLVDHHAKEGRGIEDGGSLHRVEASLVKEELEAAGFVLEAESYVLRDSSDGRDFNIFADNQKRRDKTDRFVYLFRKPLE